MQAIFGEHKSTKLFHELFAFDESFTSTNSLPNLYVYPICPPEADHPSSPIQIKEFSERPWIVPHEVLNGLHVLVNGLSRRI